VAWEVPIEVDESWTSGFRLAPDSIEQIQLSGDFGEYATAGEAMGTLIGPDGRAQVLTGKPEAFSTVLVDAGVQVDSAEVAVGVGSVFLDTTRDYRAYAYRIDSVADIEWMHTRTAAEEAARDQLRKTYQSLVKPPQATDSGNGWQVTVWMVQDRDLVIHQLGIAPGRAVSDRAETVEKDIPVPYSA
jgi:hypothetical protein